MYEILLKTKNALGTYNIGTIISNELKAGAVVALYGDLAAGKTCIARGVFEARGFDSGFSSPTFTIINEYKSSDKVACHIDAYRLSDIGELEYIGYYDCLNEAEITVIEWADIIEEALPSDVVRVFLYATENPEERMITIKTENKILYDTFKGKLNAYTCD